MMGPGFADAVGAKMIGIVIALVLFAFSLGLFAMWSIPKVWQWLKPMLHTLTA